MFKQLLITQLDSNKSFLLLWLIINAVFFIGLGISGGDIGGYMGASLISFWVLIIVSASFEGEQKRLRLFAQLPVTASMVFLSSWILVLGWIAALVGGWVLFSAVFQPQNAIGAIEHIDAGLALALFIAIVSIAIDLHAFRPAWIQWVYLAVIAALVGVAIYLDISVGVIREENGMQILPIGLVAEGMLGTAAAGLLLLALLAANYYVYTHNDHYIR